MKLSFMTFACPQWTAEECIAGAARHGYDGIEWRTDADHTHGVEIALPPSERASLRQRMADAGVATACLATSLKFIGPEAVAETPPLLDLAADLAAPGLRVFCGPLPDGVTLDDAVARVADGLRQVADQAQSRGVGLWLETHDTLSRAAPVAAVLERADHPALAANWDPMHPYFNGETWEETERLLHGRVAHAHFHDALSADPATIVPFGEGGLPCADMLRFLRAEGFTGYLSGEWFNDRLGATPDAALETYAHGLRRLLAVSG